MNRPLEILDPPLGRYGYKIEENQHQEVNLSVKASKEMKCFGSKILSARKRDSTFYCEIYMDLASLRKLNLRRLLN